MRRNLSALFLLILLAASPAPCQKLDTTSFIVMGEGLAAGMANYGLSEAVQKNSFPALMAAQMQTAFAQPLIEGPGIGRVLGYQVLPARIPTYPQTRVRIFPARGDGRTYDETPTLFVTNLSVPNLRVGDSVRLRPAAPLVQKDAHQTAVNLILGFPALILAKDVPLWTQLDYARAMRPTLVLVELGYFEALDAMVNGDPSRVPSPADFRADYSTIARALRAQFAEVVLTTIPDPLDTAYVTDLATASKILRVPPYILVLGFGVGADDYVTRNGLTAIGNLLLRRKLGTLPEGSILRAATASSIRARVKALNAEIAAMAQETGSQLYDLNAFFARVKTAGVRVGTRDLTAQYLGGFYTLDGYYPGSTGHALIANEILAFLNSRYGTSFAPVDVAAIYATDPTGQHRLGGGPLYPASDFGLPELELW